MLATVFHALAPSAFGRWFEIPSPAATEARRSAPHCFDAGLHWSRLYPVSCWSSPGLSNSVSRSERSAAALRSLGRIVPVGLLLWMLSAPNAIATDGDSAAQRSRSPDFQLLRFDEDYSYLATAGWPLSTWEHFKYVPLGGSSWISFGGELRERWEYQVNPDFGAEQARSSVWLQRATLSADLHSGPLRFYGQFLHATQEGRPGGPSPVDEDLLDQQNAFFELSPDFLGPTLPMPRIGRQEIRFGSGRLVDPREGPNVRRTFDGARLIHEGTSWTLNGLYVRPREDEPGVFDDPTSDTQALWGLYSVRKSLGFLGSSLDLYDLGYENEEALYVQGSAPERRNSLGARFWGESRRWDFNWELVGQTGEFGRGDIWAWTLATDTGYTFSESPMKPRVALSANIASGDKNPDDDVLQTFNPLYPRGNYFSEDAILGPRNFFNFHPFLTLQLNDALVLTTDVNFFWRLEKGDGVYTPSGAILRGPQPGAGRYVATAVSVNLTWIISPFVDATAIYTRFQPGEFLKDTGPSKPLDFIELTLRKRF